MPTEELVAPPTAANTANTRQPFPGRSLGHRAPLLWIVAPFIAGLFFGRTIDAVSSGWLLALAVVSGGFAVWANRRALRWWAPAIALAMVSAGMAAYALHRARLPIWDTLPAREVRVTLQIERVFAPKDLRKTSGLARIVAADAHLAELQGQPTYFSLTLPKGAPQPIRSSQVSAMGILVALPRDPPLDTFDGYLVGAGMNFRLTRGRILSETKPASPYYRFCARAAQRFKAILGTGIAEKRPLLAGLLRAMMLGEMQELSEEQRTLFMQSGTMHLFAISGLNIAVIAGSIQALLLLCRLPRWARFGIGIAILWLFVDITGAAPSAVRAFIMAAFLQTAFVLRRPANPVAAVVASALFVLVIAPLQIFSASFLMSYGIVAALLVLGLPLGDAWIARFSPWKHLPEATWRWWHRAIAGAWRWTATAVAIGVATTLVSLLTSVQFFQLLTPGALLANLVLIPAAMMATLGGFASVVSGLVGLDSVASLCNHAAAVVLLAIEALVATSVKLPGAFLPARYVAPWIGSAALAALMITLIAGYAAGWRRERGGWWPPFAVVAIVLIFGVTLE